MTREKVDFIGIGVQKAATSWLFQCLLEHPEVRGGKAKETNYFNHRYVFGEAWYHGLFEFGEWITGEFSTLYFFDKNVPERIHRYNPNAKLILSLRNPIDRAFSQHQHEVRRDRLPVELYDFSEAIKFNETYIEQGRYATHLEHFLHYYSLEQIFIALYDDVVSNPDQVLRELFCFLGISTEFHPITTNEKVNVARTYRSRKFDATTRLFKKVIREVGGDRVVQLLKRISLQEYLAKVNEKPQHEVVVPPLSGKMRSDLQEIFDPEIRRLEELTGARLAGWRG